MIFQFLCKFQNSRICFNVIPKHIPTILLTEMMIKLLELKLLLKPANIMPHLIVKKLVDFAIYVPPHQLVPNVQPFANLAKKNVRNSANLAKIDVWHFLPTCSKTLTIPIFFAHFKNLKKICHLFTVSFLLFLVQNIHHNNFYKNNYSHSFQYHHNNLFYYNFWTQK